MQTCVEYNQKNRLLDSALGTNSKPSYLDKRYKTYFAVLYVPKDVRHIIGKAKFYKSTETGNRKLAESIASIYVREWQAKIDAARANSNDPIIQSAIEIRKILKSSPAYLVADVIDEEVARLRNENKTLHADSFEVIAKGKKKHLETLIKSWQKNEKDKGLKQKTIDQMSSDVELLIKQFPTANLLTRKNITLWIKQIGRNNLTASSINRIIKSCRNFYKYLQIINEVTEEDDPDPFVVPTEFKLTKKVNAKSANKVQPWEPFEIDEITFLYQEAIKESQSLADLILIAMHTGARIEEICSLRCKDINLTEESFTISDAKTRAGIRTIPIHSFIKPRVKKLVLNSKDDYLLPNLSKNKYGDRSNALGKRFGRLKEKHQFSNRHVFHSIRKTFTTLLENNGVSENVAADIVGHEKPRITYGLYSGGSTLETMREAIEKVRYKLG